MAAWPLAARGQHSGQMRRIGVLMATVQGDPDAQARLAALRQALQELGWTDGRNVLVDYAGRGPILNQCAPSSSPGPSIGPLYPGIRSRGAVNIRDSPARPIRLHLLMCLSKKVAISANASFVSGALSSRR